jgi:hypothetical protein
VLAAHQLVRQLTSGHPPLLGHRDASPSSICDRTDDSEARDGRPTFRSTRRTPLHHYYRLDPGLTRIEAEAEAEGTIRYGCGGGTGLALFERPTEPLDRTAAAWEVDDIEKEVEELRSRGVIIDA